MKKKAIKIAAASAVAASAFVAAAPLQSNAASNVTTTVDNAVKQMQVAYHTYSDVTANGQFADINSVYKELNAAKVAYTNAKALVVKAGGAQKDANLAKLDDNYNTYITKRVVTYVDAYNYAVKNLVANKDALKVAIDAKNLVDVQKYYNEISYQLNKRTVILDRVYGQTTRDLLKSSYKADAQALKETMKYDVTVAVKVKAVTDAIAAGKLDVAKAAVDQINLNLPKVTETFKADLTTKATAAVAAYEATQTPAVVSVSAINGKELVVKFNKTVDADSVITTPGTTDTLQAGVVAVTRTSTDVHGADVAAALTGYAAALSADGKTLTITAATGTFFKGNYDVAVKGVKTANGVTTLENYYSKFIAADTTAPSVTGIVYNPASDKFEVTLSEPIDSLTGQVLRVNGTPVAFDALAVGAVTNKLTFARGSVAFGSSATIYIAGLNDGAGNLLTAYNGTVSVAKDTTALSVSSIQQVSNQKARVTFNKKLNGASDLKILGAIAANGLVVTNPTGAVTTNYSVAAAPAAVNPNGNVYDITFLDATYTSSNTQNFTVTFTKDAFTDVTGNTNGVTTQSVTLNKDVTAPTVVSTKLSNDGKKVEVTLSEDVNVATIVNANVKLRKDGAELQTGATVSASLKAGTTNVLEVSTTTVAALNVDGTLKAGTYQVRFEDGAFKDNNAVAVVATNAPTVIVAASASNPLDVTLAQGGVNKFTVTAPVGQTFTTASLTNTHFTIDGVAVSANSNITLDPTRNVITVELPITDSSKITGSALFAVNGLALESGSALNNKNATLAVTDNTAPSLVTAQLVGTNVIKLTFDENLGAFAPTTADALVDDLLITNGTVDYNGLLTDAVIGSVNGKELVITVTPGVGSNWATVVGSSTVTVKTLTAGNHDIKDTNGVAARAITVNLLK